MKKNQINNLNSLNGCSIWENNQNQHNQNQEELKFLWQQYQELELEILELHQQISTSINQLGLQKLFKIYAEKNRTFPQQGILKNGGVSS